MVMAGQRGAVPDAGCNRLVTLVHLERRLREAGSPSELGFIAVNETLGLFNFRQAILLTVSAAGSVKLAASGVSAVAPDTPFAVWIKSLMTELARAGDAKPRVLGKDGISANLRQDWENWLAGTLVYLPLCHRGEHLGGLAFSAGRAPEPQELRSVELFAEALSYALHVEYRRRPALLALWRVMRSRSVWMFSVILLLLACLVPVRSSVLAPAEVIAREPAVIRSALDGVVDSVTVKPNSRVSRGDILVRLDRRRIDNDLQAAIVQVAAAEAELRQAEQASVTDARSRLQLPMLQGKLDQLMTGMTFLKGQAERLEIRSPRDGVVILDDPGEWTGRPVSAGERILQVADPRDVELEIRLPATGVIDLDADADVVFFRNTDPTDPAAATLTYMGYRAMPAADGIVAYRLTARFSAENHGLRLGLKGTAKLYGPRVMLGYYLARRPLAALRAYAGI